LRQSADRDMVRLLESGIQENVDTFGLSAAGHSRIERIPEVVLVVFLFRPLAWRKTISADGLLPLAADSLQMPVATTGSGPQFRCAAARRVGLSQSTQTTFQHFPRSPQRRSASVHIQERKFSHEFPR